MEWIDDVTTGAWLRARLDDPWRGTMHDVVPRGFAAYARVLHPAAVRSLPDRPVPAAQEWERMPDAEQQTLAERFIDVPTTWAEAAAAFGTRMHPLAQWPRIVATPENESWHERLAPDGRVFDAPEEGAMPPALLARLTHHLAAHTTTPEAGVAALWEGWGGLVGFYGETSARSLFGWPDTAGAAPEDAAARAHERMLERSIHDRFNNVFRTPIWQPGILSDDVSKGPRLTLPGRDYVLFFAAPSVFTDPTWILDAPWRDREAEEHGFDPSAQHPSILWPSDNAWVLVSEIDFDSTVIGGSAELIAALCADEAVEAHPIPSDANLSWDADEVNR